MTATILSPASAAEAELAGAATACLVTALDRSKADVINVLIEDEGGADAPLVLKLPPKVLRTLAEILRQMAKREPMVLLPQKAELTTQQAAAFLNVSRPFVIKEIEAGRLSCRLVNRHRRIEFQEIVRYRNEQKTRSEQALNRLARLSEEMGEEL
jgi:excisionase family DNA binding protein